jgi:hypothetical protein
MHVSGLHRSVPSHDKAIEKINSLWLSYPSQRREQGIPIQEITKDYGLSPETTRAALSILETEDKLRIVQGTTIYSLISNE